MAEDQRKTGRRRNGGRRNAPLASAAALALLLSTAIGTVILIGIRHPKPCFAASLTAESASKEKRPEPVNRLIHEKSPYLLQHAHNPVDWYPWGDEAFAKARSEHKPIFLSVGYSTCHWCHVMERESFENKAIARTLNERFIAIKVDREERPDVDDFYMKAVELITRSGGWPMTLFLTPEGSPFYGGTYFPPDDRDGGLGLGTLLIRISEMWRTREPDLRRRAAQILAAVRDLSNRRPAVTGPLSLALTHDALAGMRERFDSEYGGFGGAPKFPPCSGLELLLHEYQRTGEPSLLHMATKTLEAMALGGIHDPLGGGFHRYSTDRIWLLPHFEKMLYDNAQLARLYADAYRLTGRPLFRETARDTYGWVLREMTGREGAFYSAVDADSAGGEGKFYVWTLNDILAALGPDDGRLFAGVYGVQPGGNFEDQATRERTGASVLHLERPLEETARLRREDPAAFVRKIDTLRARLFAVREKRVHPAIDDKVLTSWNGLMIASLAYGARILKEPAYLNAAERAAEFIQERLGRGNRLLHRYRAGEAKLDGYLEDYAYMASGDLEIYLTTKERRWLVRARELVDRMNRQFWDDRVPGFFSTAGAGGLLPVRSKDSSDLSVPSGNSVAALDLLTLSAFTADPAYRVRAGRLLRSFQGVMAQAPEASPTMILAAARYLEGGDHDTLAATQAPTSGGPTAAMRPHVRVAANVASRTADRALLVVSMRIDPGWHINSEQPLQSYLEPTHLTIDPPPGVVVHAVKRPVAVRVKLQFSPDPLSVYQGAPSWSAPVEIPRAIRTPATLGVRVVFQACNDTVCLRPERVSLSVPLAVPPLTSANRPRSTRGIHGTVETKDRS